MALRRSLCSHQLRPFLGMHTDSQVVHVAYIDKRLLHTAQLSFPLLTQLEQWDRETSVRKRPFRIQRAQCRRTELIMSSSSSSASTAYIYIPDTSLSMRSDGAVYVLLSPAVALAFPLSTSWTIVENSVRSRLPSPSCSQTPQ